ncbi:MAG: tryptophan synthase subunit alpha [Chloroflexota bacterium]|nr:tryptophan synthase subunit alpha [Chloroflexota bacterium]
MSGAPAPSRIAATFARGREDGRAVLIPYMTAGFPDLATSEAVICGLVAGGADLIEIGVPFSDPLADGATVQRASQVALGNGVRLADCLDLVHRLRTVHEVTIPLLFMGYYNPILRYGVEKFAQDAALVSLDGVIVPDLPAEESDDLLAACRANGRDLVFLVAPTSTTARIAEVAARASGFIYCVSLTGVTGRRSELPDLTPYLRRIRELTNLPLAIGFGISTPDHVRHVAAIADGVVVGSALINALERVSPAAMPATAEAFIRLLRTGIERRSPAPALAMATTTTE